MNLAQEALEELGHECTDSIKLVYSARFKDYNGNITKGTGIRVGLSHKWRGVDEEIQIGIIQKLFCKLFRLDKKTSNMEMYDNFVLNLDSSIEKTRSVPVLEEAFKEVNKRFFDGSVQPTNLCLSNAKKTFGKYDLKTDTIHISRHIVNDKEALLFVMYHEMLHKKLKYKTTGKRNRYHTREFRRLERQFPNWKRIEKRLAKD